MSVTIPQVLVISIEKMAIGSRTEKPGVPYAYLGRFLPNALI